MPDKKLACDLTQFLTNRNVHIIPINPQGLEEHMVLPG